ncbi:hypothetical protein QQ008_25970 [Fulvivirgaceae bacterium BMA10]|uniref:IrrE N-terminal-like domain-containing protein n=1 Tax=Splendidivirga corallicola TaxID=3051826 RepID=A0ABT8KVS3_9BACT|nr:hypothetical protein [Fulvivirgaceae bacterium BMA10]
MKNLVYISVALLLWNCTEKLKQSENSNPDATVDRVAVPAVIWNKVDTVDVADFNGDLQAGKLTLDVGVYFPSNLDPGFNKVTLPRIIESIQAAKEIYAPTGVQINLLWVKTGKVDPRFFSIQANETPGVPKTEYVNMYEHMKRHPSELTEETKSAIESIIEPHPDNHRTMYLIVLQDVFFPFLEVAEGRNWMIKSVRTGGLSFPTYSYCNTIPAPYRGIITITNLSRPDRYRRTVAHEIGHKAINVSHEYNEINPENEVFAEGGLMVYGQGEEIPSGEKGRWHLERLHLSPFLYKLNDNGTKEWNPDYQEGGHYYDPIYGDKVVHFSGVPEIDKDW